MLFQIHNGTVQYGAETILSQINFEIKDKEKIAIVGRNGCGKTTLLKLINGELELARMDDGNNAQITGSGKIDIGYLKQTAFEDESITLEEEIRKVFSKIIQMKARLQELLEQIDEDPREDLVKEYTRLQEEFADLNGYHYEREYQIILKEFGFTPEETKKTLSEFSGGQKTKIAFIKLLLRKPDILLLDEPTNHLDISTVEWLERYIKTYPKSVVIVSHDRMFLDRIVDVVYEIEYHRLTRYPGNYTKFMETKKKNWEKQKKDYISQQKEIERLNQIVEKFKNKPTKVAMTRSKLKMIEHMEKIEDPGRFDLSTFHAHFEPARESGKDVLFVKDLEIGYDSVLSTVSFEMKKGQRIGIVGGNGLGKSTLLKTLVGALKPLGGSFRYGVNVDVGYFDQQMAAVTSEKTVIDEFWDAYPDYTQTEVRNRLGAFLFSGDDVFKQVSVLSGGERVRLTLSKIFSAQPNFLILDEPTNHMDIIGKETLESMLREYPGTVLFVSHDRYFIQQVADSLLSFSANDNSSETTGSATRELPAGNAASPKNQVVFYPFGYEQYFEECEKKREALADTTSNAGKRLGQDLSGLSFNAKSNGKSNFNENTNAQTESGAKPKGYNPGKERSKLERKLAKLESQIEECEKREQQLNEKLADPKLASDYEELSKVQKELDENQENLMLIMEEWEEVSVQLEEYE